MSLLDTNELEQVLREKQIKFHDEVYRDYVLTGINDDGVFFVTVKELGRINCMYLLEEQYRKLHYAIGMIIEQDEIRAQPKLSDIDNFIKTVGKMMKLQAHYFKTKNKQTLDECKVIESEVSSQLQVLEKKVYPMFVFTDKQIHNDADFLEHRFMCDAFINGIRELLHEFRAKTGLTVTGTTTTISDPNKGISLQINL